MTTDPALDVRGDLRGQVRAAVVARTPVDAREELSLSLFVESFDELDDPFSETADPTHVTGSGIVVGPRGVLLLKHRRLGIWLQPGGHVDEGETPWDAALRECREETGLDVSFVDGSLAASGAASGDDVPPLAHVDVHAGGRGHTHLDLRYLIDGGDADPAPPPGESQEIAWFDWDVAIDMADPGLRGALESLRPDGRAPDGSSDRQSSSTSVRISRLSATAAVR